MEGYLAQGSSVTKARKYGVLIADDEPSIREALEFGLENEGFTVWLAADGQEALDLYRSHRESIDVVLLDVRMPRLDGPTTMVALQWLAPKIPCCFMSGNFGHHTEQGLRGLGARAVFRKPFDLPEVVQLLRDVVDNVDLNSVRAAGTREPRDASRAGDGPRPGALP